MSDASYLLHAVELAKRATNPSPNPRVGAVIVRGGKIVGAGFHERAGKPHAEIIALKNAGKKSVNATLYVTLEPCNHVGRTAPCTHAILKTGIKKVVIGMRDPNPLARGGAEFLERHGISVSFVKNREIQNACRELNQSWLKNLQTKLPYVTLKLALTPEGSTIPPRGKKWITSKKSRARVQLIRAEHDAILVGVNTIVMDNPRLTLRSNSSQKHGHVTAPANKSQQLIRIILDPHGRVPRHARIFHEPGHTIVVTRSTEKIPHAENLVIRDFQLKTILKKLFQRGITSILVEGGATTAAHFVKNGLIDRVLLFRAPLMRKMPHSESFAKISRLKKYPLMDWRAEKIGTDRLFSGYFRKY